MAVTAHFLRAEENLFQFNIGVNWLEEEEEVEGREKRRKKHGARQHLSFATLRNLYLISLGNILP